MHCLALSTYSFGKRGRTRAATRTAISPSAEPGVSVSRLFEKLGRSLADDRDEARPLGGRGAELSRRDDMARFSAEPAPSAPHGHGRIELFASVNRGAARNESGEYPYSGWALASSLGSGMAEEKASPPRGVRLYLLNRSNTLFLRHEGADARRRRGPGRVRG